MPKGKLLHLATSTYHMVGYDIEHITCFLARLDRWDLTEWDYSFLHRVNSNLENPQTPFYFHRSEFELIDMPEQVERN